MFELHLGDCLEWLHVIEDKSVDLIITDPAYESLEKHRAVGTTTRLVTEWFPIFKNTQLSQFLAECFRVLKNDTHFYIYCDQETMHVLWSLMHVLTPEGKIELSPVAKKHFPFKWWKHLIWEKVNSDEAPSPGMGYHYRYAQECIIFLEKGKRKLNNLGVCDVLRAPRVRGYPTEKPVSVSRTLISQSSKPGELVIDPFLGSGSTGEAALELGRSFAGCDVVEKSLELSYARFQNYQEGAVLSLRRA